MLSVIMLNVIMLSVVMVSDVSPLPGTSTLAHYNHLSITAVKSFMTLDPVGPVSITQLKSNQDK
jgi:hypothetical protein